MKRIISFVLLCAVFLSMLSGCSVTPEETQTTPPPTETTLPPVTIATAPVHDHQVENPMTYPDYSVPENYTTDDLRAIAVRAMRDMLSIEWTPARYFTYKNPYDLPNKRFHYVPDITYTGVPYTNAHTGIFQWMRYYDAETGMLTYPGDGQAWSETLGTVCADCILWGWSTVSNSIGGAFYTYRMVPQYGYLPVGDYTIPKQVTDYRTHPTDRIIADNGEQVILEAYAQVLPADALTSTPDGHAVMVTQIPNVVRNADGTIDPEASTVLIQDQRGGSGDHFYKVEKDGTTHLLSGRIDHTLTFAYLLKKGYIPVTAAEFVGQKPYTPAEAVFTGKTESLNNLYSGTVDTNYLLCNLDVILCKGDGTEVPLLLQHYTKSDTEHYKGTDGFSYRLTDLRNMGLDDLIAAAAPGQNATVKLVVQLSTGDIFELAQFPAQ